MTPEINYAPRTSEKRELFSMKIDPWLKAQAQRAAFERGQSLSSYVEEALRAFLKADGLDDREPNVG